MEYRQLGRTGLTVSEIGYGAWGIGAVDVGRRAARTSPWRRCTAPSSSASTSSTPPAATARASASSAASLRDHPDVLVATKVPPKNGVWPAPDGVHPDETFPGDHIRASLETSLAASGLEAFDVLQFHVWSDEWVGKGDWLETIADLRREGKIRFFGVSINDYQPENALELVRSGTVDTVQVIYNVFHQQPEEQLLPACAEHGVGVIVRVAPRRGRADRADHGGHDVPRGRLPQHVLRR